MEEVLVTDVSSETRYRERIFCAFPWSLKSRCCFNTSNQVMSTFFYLFPIYYLVIILLFHAMSELLTVIE